MPMRNSSWFACLPLTIALAVLAGLAPPYVNKRDNFNNNALAGFWSNGATGNIAVAEQNQRLEFLRLGNTGALSSAGVLFNPYGINWKKDFHIEWNYRFKINNMNPSRQLFMGTALVFAGNFPETMTGVACGLLRDGPLLHMGLIQYQNGSIINFDSQIIPQTTGKIEIDWDKDADRLTVKRTGGSPANLNGLYSLLGTQYGTKPMAITQGVFSLNGNVSFSSNNVYVDNWKADFFRRSFPSP